MERDDTINLAVIESSPNEAEYLSTEMRNAGHAVKPFPVDGIPALEDLLHDKRIDLIFCANYNDQLEGVCQLASERNEIPVIAITEDADTSAIISAIKAGARDLVSRNQPEHLMLVIERELKTSQKFRQVDFFETAYQESEKRCRNLLDSSRDAIAYIHDGMHIYANSVYLEMFGFEDMDDLEGLPILDMIADEELERFKEFISNYVKKKQGDEEVSVKCVRDDGTEFEAHMEFSRASIEGEPCTQVIIRDQEISQTVIAELEALKSHDALTGLYNRQAFLESMEQAIADAQAGTRPSVVFYIDIDKFEEVKDLLGIGSLDAIVSTIGKIIRENIDQNDIAARYGDHVYTVLTHEKDLKKIQLKGKTLLSKLDTIIEYEQKSIKATCSIGLAAVRKDTKTPYEVLACADIAHNEAVEAGGNTIRAFKEAPEGAAAAGGEGGEAKSTDDLKWVHRLKSALEDNRFNLAYQPVVGLSEDCEEHYEVLLRMTDEEGNEVKPGEFLPAAEKTGMINMIDRWVIGRSLHMLAEKQKEESNISLQIKLSGSAYTDDALLPWIYERTKATKIETSKLIIEVTVHDALTHAKQVGDFCRTLKKMRARIALTNFGTQDKPFELLKSVPADFIKFDGKLIAGMGTDMELLAKVTEMVNEAHGMDKPVIAPHVESAETMTVLFTCGFDYIQGNFLQEPDVVMGFDFGENEASLHVAQQALSGL